MENKICRRCGKELPLTDFYPNAKAGNMGRDAYCKKCRIEYHKSRKDIINARRREKMQIAGEYREHILAGKRKSHRNNLERAILNRAKQRAIKWGLDFDIEITDIIIPEICPLLEIPIFAGTKGNYHNSPSLDRIDNTKGYTKDNIRVISTLANSMKNAASKELLYRFIKNLPNYIEQVKI